MIIQNLLDGAKVVPREVYGNTPSLRTQEKTSNKEGLILHLKMQEKGQVKSKVNRRTRNKDQSCNKSMRRKNVKINETKSWGF